jgi:hypothetical protein
VGPVDQSLVSTWRKRELVMRRGPGARDLGKQKFLKKEFLVFLSLDIFRVFEILATIFWMEGSVTNHRFRMRDENMNPDNPQERWNVGS